MEGGPLGGAAGTKNFPPRQAGQMAPYFPNTIASETDEEEEYPPQHRTKRAANGGSAAPAGGRMAFRGRPKQMVPMEPIPVGADGTRPLSQGLRSKQRRVLSGRSSSIWVVPQESKLLSHGGTGAFVCFPAPPKRQEESNDEKMRKLLVLLTCLAMVLALAACRGIPEAAPPTPPAIPAPAPPAGAPGTARSIKWASSTGWTTPL